MVREELVLVCAGDDKFAMPMAVAASSALRHLDPHRKALVFILDDGIDPARKAGCTRIITRSNPRAALHWISPNIAVLAKVGPQSWYTRAAYLRLFIPTLLPEHLDWCIYIDGDVVVQRNLFDLWKLRSSECPVLAVLNLSNPIFATASPKAYQLSNAPADTPYFNTGVLLINMSRWRSERIAERAIDLLSAHQEKMKWVDQDILNVIFAGKLGALDESWNVQLFPLDERRKADLLPRAAILHHTGAAKPWHWNYADEAKHAFLRALLVSRWFGTFFGPLWVAAHTISYQVHKRRQRDLPKSESLVIAETKRRIPPGGTFVLVDECWLRPEALPDRHAIPFREPDGQYQGDPEDDDKAIRELERLRRSGAGHIVFVWPAFWWFDYYVIFHRYLRSHFRSELENERLVIFSLGSRREP